jgi:addiction module HigA family antidote
MKRLQLATPGEILNKDFLKPYHISAYRLALDTGMSQTRVSAIIRGKRSITPETALRLARYFGTSVDFWLNIQMHYDLCALDDTTTKQIGKIRTLKSILGSKKNGSETDTADPQMVQHPTLRPA